MASTVFLVIELLAIILYSFLTLICMISFWKSFQRKESAIISRVRSSSTFCFCFLTRAIIFLYNPITGKFMNDEMFLTLGYFVPDIIPTLLQVYIWHSRMRNEEEDSTFINSLYENEMDEDTPTPTPVNDQMILLSESSPLVIKYDYY
ncbi:hypothetical protein PPL_12516 [Heterostelium album PN500]|uniref:Uncharacterized protein n=1 Tax=Heterostelium pallidum (strain ATCC 26659 / Pp 5 / PN500) TaxID=670386 RepID=D3BMU3_HETP5|nr:hypothetical protein PPL_12516 [Heterostelium album PN500]EFA77305.1 hypothetical protein PPL_12516 [Heterostelium album PN500]|eukprot:XP_020429434.1 hypothetical protein PPL_12516 [Heterostelium album PN500]